MQHVIHAADDRVQIQDDWLDDLAPAERQQLPRQRRGRAPRLFDFLHVGAIRFADGAVLLKQIAVAKDGGENIVEVVGNAAGQASHRVHFLRLVILLLDILPLHFGAQARRFAILQGGRHVVEIVPQLVQFRNGRAGRRARAQIARGKAAARRRQLHDGADE